MGLSTLPEQGLDQMDSEGPSNPSHAVFLCYNCNEHHTILLNEATHMYKKICIHHVLIPIFEGYGFHGWTT